MLRLLRRWLFGDLGYLDRLLDGTQQGHLRQPRQHPARPAGDPRAYALRTRMLDPNIFAEFCDAYTQEMNRLRMDARQHQCCRGRGRADRSRGAAPDESLSGGGDDGHHGIACLQR